MIFVVLFGLEVALLVLSGLVGCRVCGQRPRRAVILLFGLALVDEVVIELVHRRLAGAPRPFRGVDRVAYHLETCFVLGWPSALALCGWHTFDGSRLGGWMRRGIIGLWLGSVVGLIVLFPLPRGHTAPALAAVVGLAVGAGLFSIARAWKSVRLTSREGEGVGTLLAAELALWILGAWGQGAGVFTLWDELARMPYILVWLILLEFYWRPCGGESCASFKSP